MPAFGSADEADDEAALQVKTLPHRRTVQPGMEQVRVDGVGQNVNPLGLHPGISQLTREWFRNREHQIGISPDHPFDPTGQRRAGHTGPVVLLFVGEGRVYLEDDRKSTRLNSSHVAISYAVFCLKKKKKNKKKKKKTTK